MWVIDERMGICDEQDLCLSASCAIVIIRVSGECFSILTAASFLYVKAVCKRTNKKKIQSSEIGRVTTRASFCGALALERRAWYLAVGGIWRKFIVWPQRLLTYARKFPRAEKWKGDFFQNLNHNYDYKRESFEKGTTSSIFLPPPFKGSAWVTAK